ncbi:MAG: FHA domain-containing protein [Tetrasphaera sp.]|nr:FHA domain-containing protein [Tetrasphaera sp.]
MSELTLMLMRLGLLIALWLFVFSVVGVLRGDLYGTAVRNRPPRRADKGAKASPAPNAPAKPVATQGPTHLVVTSGPLLGTTLPLRHQGTLIGRSSECALVLDDDYSSGRHARIYANGDQWFVEDLGSTNGTFLGATRITEARQVAAGSVIRIGRTTVELGR